MVGTYLTLLNSWATEENQLALAHWHNGTHKRRRVNPLGVQPKSTFLVFGSRSFLKCTLSCGLLNTVRMRKLFFLVLTVLLTVLLGRSSCSVARTFDSKKP